MAFFGKIHFKTEYRWLPSWFWSWNVWNCFVRIFSKYLNLVFLNSGVDVVRRISRYIKNSPEFYAIRISIPNIETVHFVGRTNTQTYVREVADSNFSIWKYLLVDWDFFLTIHWCSHQTGSQTSDQAIIIHAFEFNFFK